MRKIWKKGAAVLLTASMLLANVSSIAAAEEIVTEGAQIEAVAEEAPAQEPAPAAETEAPATEAPVTEPPATEAPVTEPPATEPPVTEPPATEAPVTEPPATEAPVTEPPATEAPVTEPPVTEAPATEPPATEAPVTEPPATEAPATEAPETEEPETEAPKTEKKTEAETEEQTTEAESETESGVYTVEEKGYSISITLPEGLELPEGTELKIKELKEKDETYEDDIAIAEKSAERSLAEFLIYDIHFEADEKEVELEERQTEDIEVTLTFEEAAFKGVDFNKEEVKVFHIKDMTPEEIAEAEKEAQEQQETEGTEAEDIYKQKAVELKAESEYTDTKDGVVSVTFKTDGFSDYVFAVTEEEPETEEVTTEEVTTEAVTEEVTTEEVTTEAVTEEATTEEVTTEAATEEITTEAVTEELTEAIDNAVIEDVNEEATSEAVTSEEAATEETTTEETTTEETTTEESETEETPVLTIELAVTGAVPETRGPESYTVKITGIEKADAAAVKAEYDPAAEGEAAPETAYSSKTKTLDIKVKAPGKDAVSRIKITGLKKDGVYKVEGDGNWLDAKHGLMGTADYTTICQEQTAEAVETTSPVEVTLEADKAVSLTNIYTKAVISLKDRTASVGLPGGVFEVKAGSGSKAAVLLKDLVTDANGEIVVKGLPLGTYEAGVTAIPKTHVFTEGDVRVFGITKDEPEVKVSAFTARQIRFRFQGIDSTTNTILTEAEFKVKGTDYVFNADNNFTLSGVLEYGKKNAEDKYSYIIEMTSVPYGYIKPGSAGVTLKNTSAIQTVKRKVSPTVVNISVVSKTTQQPISGVSMEIQDSMGNAITDCKWVSDGSVKTFTAKLEEGKTYKVVQTAVPDGYLKAAERSFTLTKDTNGLSVKFENQPTQVIFSRKGYDTKQQLADNKYQYTNLKMLPGAVLEVQDLNGNVIERWTTTEESHVIEGKLAAGTKYKLVEITTPQGYEKGGSGEFTTRTDEQPARVTMQTRKASGKIQVVMRTSIDGTAVKMDKTFYCALFLDEAKTQRYTAGGVKALQMTSNTVYATATFEDLPGGVYYVAQTDANGNVIRQGDGYTITFTNEKLNLVAGMSLLAEIVNDYEGESVPEDEYTQVEQDELEASYAQQYANYGGSAEAAAVMAAGDGTVQTGDNTNIILYVALLAAAIIVIVAVIVIKKKKK